MKLILSRKGFDSGSGGSPSPILPDGSLVSFPIPEPMSHEQVGYSYDQIGCGQWGSIAHVSRSLGVPSSVIARGAHFDPDLDVTHRVRANGWRPALGQAGAAAAHLKNQSVGEGDTFLFFGLFRRTFDEGGVLRWDPTARAEHVIFGWLSIGRVIEESDDDWAVLSESHADHAHLTHDFGRHNTMYLADDSCHLIAGGSGAGTFDTWSTARRLTRASESSSRWTLPGALHPKLSGASLSYHGAPHRWSIDGREAHLSSVGRGQEFVVEGTESWRSWAEEILAS